MTTRHIKAAKILADNGGSSIGEVMKQAGYSDTVVKSPSKVTRTRGWQEAMEAAGITPNKLFRVMNDGLKAEKVTTSLSGDIVDRSPDMAIRHKYLDTALKVAGAYQNTEGGSLHFHQHITGNKGKYGL
jgi:hypothetical protein